MYTKFCIIIATEVFFVIFPNRIWSGWPSVSEGLNTFDSCTVEYYLTIERSKLLIHKITWGICGRIYQVKKLVPKVAHNIILLTWHGKAELCIIYNELSGHRNLRKRRKCEGRQVYKSFGKSSLWCWKGFVSWRNCKEWVVSLWILKLHVNLLHMHACVCVLMWY